MSGVFRLPSELQGLLRSTRKDMERLTRDLSGADSAPVKAAASVLSRTWRKLLSVKASSIRSSLRSRRVRGEPSTPGQPPHEVRGLLRKSIRSAVVDGVRRVGTGSFTARLLEFGVNSASTVNQRVVVKRRGKARTRKRSAARRITIAARPHAAPALQQSEAKMVDVIVSEAQKRTAQVSL